jgi:pseudouridine synthase
MEKMEKGIVLEDGLTSPARVKKIEENMIEVTIHEGKKRIVRRMLKQLGYKVITLERARIGKLDLGNLKVGQYRNLNEEDKKKIFLHNKAA